MDENLVYLRVCLVRHMLLDKLIREKETLEYLLRFISSDNG